MAHPFAISPPTNRTPTIMLLSNIQVEWLQACIYAEQYRYAERLILATWSRPHPGCSVRHVLRYFYLRGMVHVGCQHLSLARRCFWTCLSIPSEVVSAIAVAAWKKLVLVQALLLVDQVGPQTMTTVTPHGVQQTSSWSETSPFRLPMAIPSPFTRFLNAAFEPPRQQPQQQQPYQTAPEEESMHVVENTEGEGDAAAWQQPQQPSRQQQQQQQQQQQYPFFGVKIYRDLARAFMDVDRPAVAEIIDQYHDLFVTDGTLGLVHQVQTQLYRRQVYLAARMYAVIPLDTLAQQLGWSSPQELSSLLQEMALERTWSVQVTADDMVHFPQQLPPPLATQRQQDDSSSFDSLMQLVHMVQELDVSLAASPNYAAIVKREASAAAERSGQPRGVEDI